LDRNVGHHLRRLTTGEKVVAAGVHKLDAGTPVRIVEVVQ
jgi:hypothetical protein